jgi:D-alanyl-lipoteichoic acid acyltransferase DltB (MBOAT superfamily)
MLFIPSILSGAIFTTETINNNKSFFQKSIDFLKMIRTFSLVSLGFILFRAENIGEAYNYICNLFTPTLFSIPKVIGYTNVTMLLSIIFITIMFFYEWKNRDKEYGLEISAKKKVWQYFHYGFIFFLIYFFSSSDTSSFIYFQF